MLNQKSTTREWPNVIPTPQFLDAIRDLLAMAMKVTDDRDILLRVEQIAGREIDRLNLALDDAENCVCEERHSVPCLDEKCENRRRRIAGRAASDASMERRRA